VQPKKTDALVHEMHKHASTVQDVNPANKVGGVRVSMTATAFWRRKHATCCFHVAKGLLNGMPKHPSKLECGRSASWKKQQQQVSRRQEEQQRHPTLRPHSAIVKRFFSKNQKNEVEGLTVNDSCTASRKPRVGHTASGFILGVLFCFEHATQHNHTDTTGLGSQQAQQSYQNKSSDHTLPEESFKNLCDIDYLKMKLSFALFLLLSLGKSDAQICTGIPDSCPFFSGFCCDTDCSDTSRDDRCQATCEATPGCYCEAPLTTPSLCDFYGKRYQCGGDPTPCLGFEAEAECMAAGCAWSTEVVPESYVEYKGYWAASLDDEVTACSLETATTSISGYCLSNLATLDLVEVINAECEIDRRDERSDMVACSSVDPKLPSAVVYRCRGAIQDAMGGQGTVAGRILSPQNCQSCTSGILRLSFIRMCGDNTSTPNSCIGSSLSFPDGNDSWPAESWCQDDDGNCSTSFGEVAYFFGTASSKFESVESDCVRAVTDQASPTHNPISVTVATPTNNPDTGAPVATSSPITESSTVSPTNNPVVPPVTGAPVVTPSPISDSMSSPATSGAGPSRLPTNAPHSEVTSGTQRVCYGFAALIGVLVTSW